MKVLVSSYHHPVCTGRFLTAGFQQLGDDVRHVGTGSAWNEGAASGRRWVPDGDFGARWQDWEPRLLVVVDPLWPTPRMGSPYSDAKAVLYCTDPHVCNMRYPGYDGYILPIRHGPEWRATKSDEYWVPFGYDPEAHSPSTIPWAEREYDACIVGNTSRARFEREGYVDALKAAGLKVYHGTDEHFEDYRARYHNSRIALCGTIYGSLAMRYFEGAAMGCLPVCLPSFDLADLNPPGYVIAMDPLGMARACREAVDDEAGSLERLRLAMNWVRPHTWAARAAAIKSAAGVA